MSRTRSLALTLLGSLVACALGLGASPISAQSGGGYNLRANVQGAGGGTLTGAEGYSLGGAVAQPGANELGAMIGGNNYALHGGLFPHPEVSDVIFGNGFESQ